jgi:hypothetical protein
MENTGSRNVSIAITKYHGGPKGICYQFTGMMEEGEYGYIQLTKEEVCNLKNVIEVDDKKVCKLIDDYFSWFLEVDGFSIPFQASTNARYFAKHYKSLGYKIEWVMDRWKKE